MDLNSNPDIFIPDGTAVESALSRSTHLGIGAHQDDLEIGMVHGVLDCFGKQDFWFTGITCTDGAGSARSGVYSDYSDDEMKGVREQEQRAAAAVGRYSALYQLGYSSANVKDPKNAALADDLHALLLATSPSVVYTHNPADKHETHVAVFLATLDALRRLPADKRPANVYGCETWRGLDWMPDARKVVLDLSGRDNLLSSLLGAYDSQVSGGKRYDLATIGRYRANATYLASHSVDTMDLACYAMDLKPLVEDKSLDPADYVAGLITEFTDEINSTLTKMK
jgi:LmbE family N-acetylglucosaminyl deacetylase